MRLDWMLRWILPLATAWIGSFSVNAEPAGLLERNNLVAWCVVPFDAAKRGPEDRAEMLAALGFSRLAYDWRDEHLPTFDAEIEAMKAKNIEITAWWMPATLNDHSRLIIEAIRRHKIQPQFWVMLGEPLPESRDLQEKAAAAAEILRPLALEAQAIDCKIALYNHGGWFGEPANQIAILKALDLPNVGIVYNFHHGHDHLADFPAMFDQMKPHLLALNLNGMVEGGDRKDMKILQLGEGDRELGMLRHVIRSGWTGPIGILDHRPETDSAETLRENLEGLDRLIPLLEDPGADAFWMPEDATARAALPEFRTIPAALPDERTPATPGVHLGAAADWPRSHADQAGTRFSRLTGINRENVGRLEPAWTYHSGDGAANIQCNPVIVDGVIFTPTPGDQLVAIDGRTGAELWRVNPGGRPAHRGLTYWKNPSGGGDRLIFTSGNFLYALNPATGKPVAGFGVDGRVLCPQSVVPPVIFENILASAGFDRDVHGFDLLTGEPLWTFHTVPRADEPGAETWSQPGQGANCWGGMSLDEERGIAYVSTGSPKPNFVGIHHRGDNLYANCVIAIDMRTGKRIWHFQEIRHDIWDLDIPAPPNLLTVHHEGKAIAAVAQVTKIGHTLLLDRVTGKPLFPYRLGRAPASTLPGERTAPWQPHPELPQAFSRQEFSLNDVTTRTPEASGFVLKQLERANFGWFEPFQEGVPTALYGIHGGAEWTGAAVNPDAGLLYVSSNEIPWLVTVHRAEIPQRQPGGTESRGASLYATHCAACHGRQGEGVGVAPPLQGLRHRMDDAGASAVILNGRNNMPATAPMDPADHQALLDFLFLRDPPASAEAMNARPVFTHNGYPKLLDPQGYPGSRPPWGTLNCIDLNTGKRLWQVPLGEYPELIAAGLPPTGTENFGGAIATAAGLIFCAGTRDGLIRAFDADDGRELWRHPLPWGGNAPPAMYEAGGKSYIVIPATGGGKLGGPAGDAWVAFSLPE